MLEGFPPDIGKLPVINKACSPEFDCEKEQDICPRAILLSPIHQVPEVPKISLGSTTLIWPF